MKENEEDIAFLFNVFVNERANHDGLGTYFSGYTRGQFLAPNYNFEIQKKYIEV